MQSSITRVLPRVAAIPRVAAAVPARSASSMGSNFYRYVARSNVTYVSYIIGGAILLEAIYGKTLDGLWNGLNSGKTYDSVDWSKFKSQFEEEEESE